MFHLLGDKQLQSLWPVRINVLTLAISDVSDGRPIDRRRGNGRYLQLIFETGTCYEYFKRLGQFSV